jgi:hypothetical protein
MRRPGFLLAILTILLLGGLTSVAAVPDLLIDAHAIDAEINFNEVAKYSVELTNNRDEKIDLTMPIPRNAWDITIKPYILEIYPHTSQTVEVAIAPPQDVKSGTYSVYFQFKEGTELLDYKYLHVKILEDSPVVEKKINIIEEIEAQEVWAEELFVKSYTVTIQNKGNAEATGSWETPISSMDSFFISSEGAQISRDELKVSWDYQIPIRDSATYTYKISYIPLVTAVILILVALSMLGIYYMSRYKLVKTIKKKRDGYLSIELALKNKTGKAQKNITLEDHVPVPFLLSREFGTISPTAIKKQKDKLVVLWKFDELLPHEERVLSYKIKSKLQVEGELIIPAARVIQKTKGEKPVEIYSKTKQL